MARRSAFQRGSILGGKDPEPEPADTRDMTQRVVDRAMGRNTAAEPPAEPKEPVEKNKNEASILHHGITQSNDHGNNALRNYGITQSNMLAKNDFSELTLSDYVSCALPSDEEDVKAFVVAAGKVKTQNVTIRLSTALDILVSRIAGGHVAVKKVYKSDFIRRCIQLGLYELYTGKRLVTLGDEEDEEGR